MRWSRIGAAVITVVLAGALTLAGTGIAEAATYPNTAGPIETLPDGSFSSTNLADLAMYEMEMEGRGSNLLSRMSPIQRGNTVLLAGSAGFVIGAAGVRLVYAATGQNWDSAMCTLPTIVREGYTIGSLGIGASNCAQPIISPNSDQGGSVTVGTFSATYTGDYSDATSGVHCYKLAGSQPAGTRAEHVDNSTGNWTGTAFSLWTSPPCPGGGTYKVAAWNSSGSWGIPIRIVNTTTNAVVGNWVQTNPTRQGRCQVLYDTGSPTFGQTIQYAESAGFPLTSFQNSCSGVSMNFSDGRKVTGVNLQTSTNGGSTWSNLVTSPVPPETQTLPSEFPDCFKPGKTCTLTLEKTIGVTGDTVDCFDDPSKCVDWATKTSNATVNPDPKGDEWKCKYGQYEVSLAKCLVYKNAFSTSTQPGTVQNPNTGNELDPGTNTGTGTGTSTDTNAGNPGNTITPGTDVGTSTGQCMASWFSTFNPIDWVMTPVKCALKWAFEPRQDVIQSRWGTLQQRWKQTAIGGLATAVGAWSFVSPGTGCGGINVPLSTVFGHGVADITILKACAGDPLAGTAQLSSVVIGIAAVLGVIMAVTRALGGVVGARGLGDDGGRSP